MTEERERGEAEVAAMEEWLKRQEERPPFERLTRAVQMMEECRSLERWKYHVASIELVQALRIAQKSVRVVCGHHVSSGVSSDPQRKDVCALPFGHDGSCKAQAES